jgi:hypothetical protein
LLRAAITDGGNDVELNSSRNGVVAAKLQRGVDFSDTEGATSAGRIVTSIEPVTF